MFALVLLGCLALSSAAPRHYHHPYHHHGSSYEASLERYLEEEMFNTRRFWDELRREMLELDTMLADFGRYYPSSISSEQIEGNEYIITISLPNYEEKEIAVKARKGLVMVQAVHQEEGEPQRNYLDVRTLPDCVNEAGSWSFENGVLKIVFPIAKKEIAEGEVPTEAPVTEAPQHSREDMEPTSNENANRNADVESDRGDLGKNTELLTNEIPKHNSVETTTHAVDLKDEVELVPARY
ncbi:unnamed protein product, partial [Brenthis ino]